MKRLLFVIFLFSSIVFLGCVNSNPSYDKQVEVYNKYINKFRETKDPIRYKKLLEQEIMYFKVPFFSDESIKYLRASILRSNYECLFFIEETLGNKYQADIYYRKAQYWNIISMECFSMLSTKELAEKSKRTKEKIIKHMTKLNPNFLKGLEAMAKAEKNKKPALDSSSDTSQKD